MNRIGVLTSGGDAPGMNACIRAIVRSASAAGIEVMGIMRGYDGLISNDMSVVGPRDVSNTIQAGGSFLESSRCPEFETVEGRKQAHENMIANGIEGLIVIGGDGTFRGAEAMQEEHDVAIVGVPGTIDNDVWGSDYTIGFDSAVNCAVDAIDRIKDTARTFRRVFFIEVMGKENGYIALVSGVAGGAEGIFVPEVPDDIDAMCAHLEEGHRIGKKSAIIVVSEHRKPGYSFELADIVARKTGFETRVCVLGHLQRGGKPTAADRILASELGAQAVLALAKGQKGVMVGIVGGDVMLTPFRDTFDRKKPLNARIKALVPMLS